MTLHDELYALIRSLRSAGVDYALCGGLAVAAHGWPRATMDIDILVDERSLDNVLACARELGFTHDAGEMNLAQGRVRLRRVVKMAGTEAVPLDILLVTPALQGAWEQRTVVETEAGPLCVVSPEGLAAMKSLRNSGQDRDDIRRLRGEA